MTTIFDGIAPIRHEGTASTNPLAFRRHDPPRVVLGKTMAAHLRFAVCSFHDRDLAPEGTTPRESKRNREVASRSGRQKKFENLVRRYL